MSAQTHPDSTLNDHTKDGDETGRTVTFIVNAREQSTSAKTLTFEELVAIAFPAVPSGPNVLFTVSYRRGRGDKPEGSLLAGDVVKVKDGMVFVVSATDKS